jgi:hypothetical protein
VTARLVEFGRVQGAYPNLLAVDDQSMAVDDLGGAGHGEKLCGQD